jgi:hypothetical protein
MPHPVRLQRATVLHLVSGQTLPPAAASGLLEVREWAVGDLQTSQRYKQLFPQYRPLSYCAFLQRTRVGHPGSSRRAQENACPGSRRLNKLSVALACSERNKLSRSRFVTVESIFVKHFPSSESMPLCMISTTVRGPWRSSSSPIAVARAAYRSQLQS